MPDKFTATWISHSSISDYIACPRAYYLKNVHKDPNTGRKITLITPALALGQAVHEQLEALSVLPVEQRVLSNLVPQFQKAWEKYSGEKGGFAESKQERQYKGRGEEMMRRVFNHPGPLKNKAVKIKKDLLYYWLSEEDEIILCGKIDWMEYFPEQDNVHIIDFKTGERKEQGSLQLPIYYLLAKNSQKRNVAKMSYWYLALDDGLTSFELPDEDKAREEALSIGRKIKLARQLGKFDCPHDGCRKCEPFERIIKGQGKLVGVDDFNRDMYILPELEEEDAEEVIL